MPCAIADVSTSGSNQTHRPMRYPSRCTLAVYPRRPHRRLRGGVAIRGRSMPTAGTPERVTLRAGERAKMPPTPGSTAGPYGDSGIAALMTSDEAACSGPLSLTALSRS
jgi:hypothetical protein